MVRMRCGIVEDEPQASALEKVRATIDEHIPDPDERRYVEPRLSHLLGLEEGVAGDQENLFAAWRILFERLSDRGPTVIVFEDMQWADAGLIDFPEYLLDWSRNHPLFSSRSPDPSSPKSVRAGALASAASRRSTSSRSRRRR
jgi:predicted ATPase